MQKDYAERLRARRRAEGWETHDLVDVYLDFVGLPSGLRRILSEKCESKHDNVVQKIKGYLSKDLANPWHCPFCGGVLPELAFRHRGKKYYFTCYKIEDENRQITAQTRYVQFARWCSKSCSKTRTGAYVDV